MTIKMQGQFVLLCVLLLACLAAHAQTPSTPTVKRIVIESSWAGLGIIYYSSDHIVIDRQGDVYRLSGTHTDAALVIRSLGNHSRRNVNNSERNGSEGVSVRALKPQIISPNFVTDLRDAILAKPQPLIELATLNPTASGIQVKIDDLLKQTGLVQNTSPVAGRVFAWRQGLRESSALARVITFGFLTVHTDDFPKLSITMTLDDQSTISASSQSQHYLMLPWKVANGRLTYSPTIARAVLSLLPRDSVDKDRLEGAITDNDLDEILYAGIEPDIEQFQVARTAPAVQHLLEEHFVVSHIAINTWQGRNVDAHLRLPDGPSNLMVLARMALSGDALRNANDVDNIQRYLRLIQSSPILLAKISADANISFVIKYGFKNSWPNKRAMEQFVQQMHAMKALPDLTIDSPSLRNSVLLEEGMRPIYWVVLSDGRAIKWKEFVLASDGQNTEPCPGLPSVDSDGTNEMSEHADRCIGTVYGHAGGKM